MIEDELIEQQRILICGSRNLHIWMMKVVEDILDQYDPESCIIIQGHARGADAVAFNEAIMRCFITVCVPANWNKNGKAAGPIRNRRMIAWGKPDVVYALFESSECRDSGKGGTSNMVKQAKRHNVPVVEYVKSKLIKDGRYKNYIPGV